MFRVLRFFVLAVAALWIVTACGGNRLGYGVLLWSIDEEVLPSGSVVQIVSESRMNETYTVQGIDIKQGFELPDQRVAFFKKRNVAVAFADQYKAFAPFLAYVERDGLPVRDEPSASGQRVYKLRKNQVIKILGRQGEKEEAGNLEGYWYKVLTEDGINGYTFSVSLKVFDMNDESVQTAIAKNDPYIESLVSYAWRPDYFSRMVKTNRIDLKSFRPEYGLFLYPEERRMELFLPEHKESLQYTDIVSMGNNAYRIVGTPVEIIFINQQRLELVYSSEEKRFSETFILFNQDIRKILAGEGERRKELYDQFLMLGTVFSSTAYGTITFDEYPRFRWDNFRRLVPEVIPEGAAPTGTVDFSLFLSRELRKTYNGGIIFIFGDPETGHTSGFLYEIEDTGIRFTFVQEKGINEGYVKSIGTSPIILFFSFPEG